MTSKSTLKQATESVLEKLEYWNLSIHAIMMIGRILFTCHPVKIQAYRLRNALLYW